MIRKLQLYRATGSDPFENLAVEEYLLHNTPRDCCTLYLWQNQNTVVIGQNQNPWAECRVSLLEAHGGKLARRLSGGGAVFHDLGNLNFTFLVNEEDYDLDKQLSVIQTACALAGIQTEKSGRNDLLAQGRKFSGNAFYHSQGKAYHHGTLLIHGDMDKMQQYLSPPKAKLESKGVSSVRSRVINLQELVPSLSVEAMAEYMQTAFCQVYGLQSCQVTAIDPLAVAKIKERTESWDYRFGKKLPFSMEYQARFSWGSIQLLLNASGGKICQTQVYTDAMDWQLPTQIQTALTGCPFTKEAMAAALEKALPRQQAEDILLLVSEQS